jgi:hypothetical protein
MNNLSKIFSKLALCLFFSMGFSVANAAGGLSVGTDALDGFKVWLYGILFIACMIYIISMAILAMIQKKQWGDVGMAVVYSAAAGGSVAAATWGWGLWQTTF